MLSLSDFGLQRGEVFEPELFREFFVPAWKVVCDAAHKACPHVKVFIHCCGSVPNLIP
ncbi:MAG: uroporphyrinogen decarboxylase family protein, partial [Anaerolineales bacterium]